MFEEKEVYQKVFLKFENGGFQPTWSWAGFLLGGIWYFVKGMWAKGLIIFAISILTGGILWIPMTLYCGVFGKYDYYLWKVKKKQLW